MQIWVDADACPKIARDIIIKATMRTQILATFVSNRYLSFNKTKFIKKIVVEQGADKADQYIIDHAVLNDIVVTSDIPMADLLINKGCRVLNFHGKRYTPQNIKQSLNMRDFMETMRGSGVIDPTKMGGQTPYSEKDKKSFADGLNNLLQQKV